jgi:hypothetical protein
MTKRSEYLGVYTNTQDSSKAEVPFRAAIRRGNGEKATWVNLGYTVSEKVAARVYNIYAICFFGKGAIINDINLDLEEMREFEAFINAKPNRRARLDTARDKANAIIAAGHTFRKHTELKQKEQVEMPV